MSEVNKEPTPDKTPNGYSDCSQPSPAAGSWDIIPAVEKVGVPTRAELWVENHGPDLQDVVLDLHNSVAYWKVNARGSDLGNTRQSRGTDAYDYGSLSCGNVLHITLSLTPLSAGKHGFDALFDTGMQAGGFANGTIFTAPAVSPVNVLP